MAALFFYLLTLVSPAYATNYTVEFCVEYTTNFSDLGGDFWFTNDPRPARGIYLVVERVTSGVDEFADYVGSTDGCETLVLSDSYAYQIYSVSKAETNGVESIVYDDILSPANYAWVHNGGATPFRPELSDGTETLTVNASTASAQLAVASLMMYGNNMGVASALTLYDDDCCNGGQEIQAATFSKTIIAHEVAHGIGYRRDGSQTPNFDYNANEDNCDGDNVDQNKHRQVVKEYQSAAAVEGFADTLSAWTWNDESQGDCLYDRHHGSDFDLDGDIDNANGQLNCEGIPTSGLQTYIHAKDWLEEVIAASDPAGCTGSSVSRSSQLDWLRYGWDMLQDEAVPVDDIVWIYDNANPQNWDADDNTFGSDGSQLTTDDVIVRWASAAASHANDYSIEHDDQKDNGLDH